MQAFWDLSEDWLLRSAVGGALILSITWLLVRITDQPAKQQRLAEWGMGASLLLVVLAWFQPWAVLDLYRPSPQPMDLVADQPPSQLEPDNKKGSAFKSYSHGDLALETQEVPYDLLANEPWIPFSTDSLSNTLPLDSSIAAVPMDKPPSAPVEKSEAERSNSSGEKTHSETSSVWQWLNLDKVLRWLLVGYLLGGSFFLGRWVLGHLSLAWLIWRAHNAPKSLLDKLASLKLDGGKPLRLLVSDSLRVPICCGLWKPTILLPRTMIQTGSDKVLRWVLAHELTHLDRRDAWGALLFNLGQLVYYYLPWYWQLRWRVALCQEYVADASAAEAEMRLDYAQFLLGMTRMPALPVGARGVSGNSCDLFRRITMLVRSPIPLDRRVPHSWSLVTGCCLLAIAVLLSGVGLRVNAAPASQPPATRDEPKKEETKKDQPKKDEPINAEAKKENPADAAKSSIPDIQQRIREVQLERQKSLDKMREEMEKLQADLRKNMAQFPPQARAFNGVAAVEGGAFPSYFPQDGRLGVRVQKPSETLAEQLDLPKGQGLVIEQVTPDSAAAKAGIKPHDILLEIGGKAVPDNPAELIKKIMSDIKADTKVDVVVLRKGKKETIKDVAVPEAKAGAANPFFQGGGRIDLPNMNLFPQGVIPPGFPGAAGGAGAAAAFPGGRILNVPAGVQGVMTTMFRNDDRFTLRHQEGSLIITVTGKVSDGKAKTSEIQVQDGTTTNKYETVDKVPEQYRDKVKSLVEMSEKGNVKVEIKE